MNLGGIRGGWLRLGLVVALPNGPPLASLFVFYDTKRPGLEQDWVYHQTYVGPVPANNRKIPVFLRVLSIRVLPGRRSSRLYSNSKRLSAAVATKHNPLRRHALMKFLLVRHRPVEAEGLETASRKLCLKLAEVFK